MSPPVFHASAYLATVRSVFFSPSPPIRIGSRAWTGGGSLRTSRRVIARASGRGRLAVEHRPHQLDRFVEPVEPLAEPGPEVDPVRLVLPLEPGPADPEDRASGAHVVERRDHLGGQGGVAERVRPDHQADRRSRGHARPAGQDQVALEDRAAPIALDGIEVVPGPQRVIAQLVGSLPDTLERGPIGLLAPGQHADLDLRHLKLS